MYSLVVLLHGVCHTRRVAAAVLGAVIRRPFVMSLRVLPQIVLVLEAEKETKKGVESLLPGRAVRRGHSAGPLGGATRWGHSGF